MIYFLSLGSNLGEREQTLNTAKQQIEQHIGPITRCSSFYYSAPWGFVSKNEFCNICCAVETDLCPMDVLSAIQAIERALGRTKKSTNGQYVDRTIDIDIIKVYDGEKELEINTPTLTIPHPLWKKRDFVCVPLKEITNEQMQ